MKKTLLAVIFTMPVTANAFTSIHSERICILNHPVKQQPLAEGLVEIPSSANPDPLAICKKKGIKCSPQAHDNFTPKDSKCFVASGNPKLFESEVSRQLIPPQPGPENPQLPQLVPVK